MEQIIAECKFIWTEEYLQDVIRILQKGRGGTTLHNSEYNLIKKYKIVRSRKVYIVIVHATAKK